MRAVRPERRTAGKLAKWSDTMKATAAAEATERHRRSVSLPRRCPAVLVDIDVMDWGVCWLVELSLSREKNVVFMFEFFIGFGL